MKLKDTQKRYPIEINEYYSPGLNSLKRIYTQHPKFNGNTRLIYELLFDYWNADYGYAFPTHWDLAKDSGLSRGSVIKQIKILEELDLIEVRKSPIGDRKNNVYIVKAPLSTLEAFYAKFPEVEAEAKERLRKIETEEQALQAKWSKDKSEGKEYTKAPEEPEPIEETAETHEPEPPEPMDNIIEETEKHEPPEQVEYDVSSEEDLPKYTEVSDPDDVDDAWF